MSSPQDDSFHNQRTCIKPGPGFSVIPLTPVWTLFGLQWWYCMCFVFVFVFAFVFFTNIWRCFKCSLFHCLWNLRYLGPKAGSLSGFLYLYPHWQKNRHWFRQEILYCYFYYVDLSIGVSMNSFICPFIQPTWAQGLITKVRKTYLIYKTYCHKLQSNPNLDQQKWRSLILWNLVCWLEHFCQTAKLTETFFLWFSKEERFVPPG